MVTSNRILVLDADSNAGWAVTQSLGRAGYECTVAATTDSAPAFGSRWARDIAIYPDPLTDLDAFKSWMATWVARKDIALVIPATECTLVPLHEMRDELSRRVKIAIPSKDTLDVALDKERVRLLAAELGVEAPASRYVTSVDHLSDHRIDRWLHESAVVVKTTKSKIWQGKAACEFPAAIVTSREELHRVVCERLGVTPVQVQEWVPGRGLGVLVLARRGQIVLSVAQERLHEVPLTGGSSSYRRTIPMPPALYDKAARLMKGLSYDGVAMIEFRGDLRKECWLMELNPRFWGSLPLAIFAGADFPLALVELILHDRIPTTLTSRHYVYARNVAPEVKWLKLMIRQRGRT